MRRKPERRNLRMEKALKIAMSDPMNLPFDLFDGEDVEYSFQGTKGNKILVGCYWRKEQKYKEILLTPAQFLKWMEK